MTAVVSSMLIYYLFHHYFLDKSMNQKSVHKSATSPGLVGCAILDKSHEKC